MSRRWTTLVASLTLFTIVSLAWAQEPAKPGASGAADTKTARKAYDPARRVPPYFGQVGLTPEQKEKLYTIRTAHFAKIAAIKGQLEKASRDMMDECEGLLTPAQKDLLKQRRDAAQVSRATSKVKAEPTPSAEKP